MFLFKRTDVRQQREIDDLKARAEKQAADIEYLSMMADIEIPTEEGDEYGTEQEI